LPALLHAALVPCCLRPLPCCCHAVLHGLRLRAGCARACACLSPGCLVRSVWGRLAPASAICGRGSRPAPGARQLPACVSRLLRRACFIIAAPLPSPCAPPPPPPWAAGARSAALGSAGGPPTRPAGPGRPRGEPLHVPGCAPAVHSADVPRSEAPGRAPASAWAHTFRIAALPTRARQSSVHAAVLPPFLPPLLPGGCPVHTASPRVQTRPAAMESWGQQVDNSRPANSYVPPHMRGGMGGPGAPPMGGMPGAGMYGMPGGPPPQYGGFPRGGGPQGYGGPPGGPRGGFNSYGPPRGGRGGFGGGGGFRDRRCAP